MALKRHTVGALAVLALFAVGLTLWLLLKPSIETYEEIKTSDAAQSKGTLTLLTDNFIGYLPMCSSHMKDLMLADGWRLTCEDDGAAYSSRYRRVARGDAQFAFAPIDAFVMEREYRGGRINMVIDRSVGADGLVCNASTATSVAELKQVLDIKVAYAADSPSQHLLKAIAVDFDIPLFKLRDRKWAVETNGSDAAYESLVTGGAECAFLWEPNLSVAVEAGYNLILSTADMPNTIVDTLVTSRQFLSDEPTAVHALFENYFRTLKHYRDNPEKLRKEAARYAGVSEQVAGKMLAGVEWQSLEDNATQWFGLSSGTQMGSHGLVKAIDRVITVLQQYGDITENPLPDGDPRRIIDSKQIVALYQSGVGGNSFLLAPAAGPLEGDFTRLSEAAWNGLVEVGPLQERDVLFQSGSAELTRAGKLALDEAAVSLEQYPNFRLEVQGHTAKQGNEAANIALSQARAEAVKRYFVVTYGVDKDRINAVGLGSSVTLPREPNEPYRAYLGRQARVELHLKREVY